MPIISNHIINISMTVDMYLKSNEVHEASLLDAESNSSVSLIKPHEHIFQFEFNTGLAVHGDNLLHEE